MPHIDSPLPLQIYFTLNANTACRGYRSFLCPRTRASTAVGFSIYRYRNVRTCALPLPLTFVLNANTACRGYRSFLCPRTRASTAVGIKKNTLTSESVRVGRSYRNRTYTVGVRGPSATTTPSSIAWIIIYQSIAI